MSHRRGVAPDSCEYGRGECMRSRSTKTRSGVAQDIECRCTFEFKTSLQCRSICVVFRAARSSRAAEYRKKRIVRTHRAYGTEELCVVEGHNGERDNTQGVMLQKLQRLTGTHGYRVTMTIKNCVVRRSDENTDDKTYASRSIREERMPIAAV